MNDVSVNNRANPHVLQVVIKQSKTDPFRRGVNIYLDATDITCLVFSSALDSLLSKLKPNRKKYNTHSF